MMDADRAKKLAAKIKIPSGGVVVTLKIEVALAFMQLHNLEKKSWTGDILILHRKKPSDLDPSMVGYTSKT